jgi:hypothetical protein
MRVLGIDPGINECSYAVLNDRGELVEAGLIPNPYKKTGRVEKLKKASMMCQALREKLYDLEDVDIVMIEASTGSSGGLKNYNTMCRMALVSGCAYGACDADHIDFVAPQTWKVTRDKFENHEIYLKSVPEIERGKLDNFLNEVAASKQHNVIDAFCIALWTFNHYY